MDILQSLADMILYVWRSSIESHIMLPLYYLMIVSVPAMLLKYLFKEVRRF